MIANRIPFFCAVALIEGLTALALCFIAMPIKYGFGNPMMALPVGGLPMALPYRVYIAVMLTALPARSETSG